jgi:galactitol-specific phosphotransferase system IIB component
MGGEPMHKKMILVICGAGINTSTAARDFVSEELAKRNIKDIDVKHAMISDLGRYRGRTNMVIISMARVDVADMEVPSFPGLVFLIGKKQEKVDMVEKIIATFKSTA